MRKLLFSIFLALGFTIANAQTPADTIPTIPNITTSKKTAVVTIQPGKGNTKIELEVMGPGLNTVFTETASPNTNFYLSNLTPNQAYKIRTRGIITCPTTTPPTPATTVCYSNWSAEKYFFTEEDYPKNAILNPIGDNCPEFIGLSWKYGTIGAPIDHLDIDRSFDGGATWNPAASQLGPSATSFYDLGAIPGEPVSYRILTYNSIGDYIESNIISTVVTPWAAPKAAKNLMVSQGSMTDDSFRITWENPSEDYKCGTDIRAEWWIYIRRDSEPFDKLYAITYPNATYYDIWGLLPNEKFTITIRAISDKNIPGDEAVVSGKTYGPASPVSNLIVVAFQDAIDNSVLGISWDHPEADADYFKIELSIDGENYLPLGTINTKQNHILHSNISEGVRYKYRVKAGNYLYGESDWVYSSFVSHDYTAAPTAPYALRANLVDGKVNLKWVDDSNKEENYVIERSSKVDGTFNVVGIVDRNTTTFTDEIEGLEGKTFYYRVSAKNPLGTSASSNVAEVIVGGAETSGFTPNIGILAYPNPTVDVLNISIPADFTGENVNVKVYNQLNQMVISKSFNSKSDIELNMKRLTPGLYNVVVELGDLKETKKVIKN